MSVAVTCVYGIPDAQVREELTGTVIVFDESEECGEFIVCNPSEEEAIKKVVWDHLFLEFTFFGRVGNRSKDSEQMKKVFAKVSYFLEGIHLTASDLKHSGLPLLSNFLRNEKFFEKARKGKELFGRAAKVPALICGAGASLEGALSDLKRLRDQALIFAGGTALSCLSRGDVIPHFAAHIDPHPPGKRAAQNRFLDVPTFFQSRAHPDLLEKVQGPLLWLPGNAHDFFDEEHFDGGWNVATFLTAIAYHMGCDPIILVGVDCAQTKDKTYAGVDCEEEVEVIALENGLYSRKDWLMAGRWLTELAQKDPSVQWVEVPGGLELEGFSQKTLSTFEFKSKINLSGIVEGLSVQKCAVSKADDVRASLQKVGHLCETMLKRVEAHFPHFPQASGSFIVLEAEMEQEMAFQQFLWPIWKVFRPLIERQMPPLLPKEQGLLLNQWLFMKRICDDARAL